MNVDCSNMKVRQLMSSAHDWNAEILANMFSEELVRMVCKVLVAYGWWLDTIF